MILCIQYREITIALFTHDLLDITGSFLNVEGYEIFACDLQSRLLMKTAKPFALKTLKKMTDNMETVVYNGYEFYRFGVYAFDQYFYMTALGLDTEVFCIGVVDEHQLDNVFLVFDILLDENSKHAHDNVQL